ncbi:MAG: hypothetical protein NTZ55_05045 [Candidatus Roizmanbacteria bacterium]|nr:hypothetical protein [Candidatus Roizmanbacteria bacterium]
MIPQILTITDEAQIETTISQFAHTYGIPSAQIMVIRPEKDEITVDQIHLVQKDIQFSFKEKVLVAILALDVSSIEVQNSLLKCLEEDSERIQFLFLVHNATRLLPTILSRCTIVQHIEPPHADKPVTLYEELFSYKNNSDNTKEDAVAKIDSYIEYSDLKDSAILNKLLNIRKLIIDNNVNPILALDHILIFLSKTSTMKVSNEK